MLVDYLFRQYYSDSRQGRPHCGKSSRSASTTGCHPDILADELSMTNRSQAIRKIVNQQPKKKEKVEVELGPAKTLARLIISAVPILTKIESIFVA